MSLRSKISGTYNGQELERLTWPIAWSGVVPDSEQREEEAELRSLVSEAKEAISEWPDGVAVEIKDGEIQCVVTSDA